MAILVIYIHFGTTRTRTCINARWDFHVLDSHEGCASTVHDILQNNALLAHGRFLVHDAREEASLLAALPDIGKFLQLVDLGYHGRKLGLGATSHEQ